MPHHEHVALAGVIEHVFAHRFTLIDEGLAYLADLGPKGAEAFRLESGAAIRLEGERRPSEIKVSRISTKGGRFVEIEHKKPHHGHKHHHPDVAADPPCCPEIGQERRVDSPWGTRSKAQTFRTVGIQRQERLD